MKPRPLPTISGDLATTSIASLLWSLRQRGLTGTLALHGECHAGVSAGETLLTFEGGALTQIRQPQPLDTLGCLLREHGAITGEQFDESLARLAAREGLQGDILVAMGACGPEAVVRGLRAQLRRKAMRVFALEKGRMEFFRGCDLLTGFGGARHPEDLLPLLWPGMRAYPEHAAVAAAVTKLGAHALRLKPSTELSAFGFEGAERSAIERLQAGPAAFAALESTGATTASVRALVALLLITGLAELSTDAPPRSASGVQPVFQQRPLEAPRRISSSNLPIVRDLGVRASARPQPPPQVIPPRPAPIDVRARMAAAEARLASMQDETYFQMLGLDASMLAQDFRTPYQERVAQWRPEAAPESAIALREVHQQIHALLDEAHTTLSDEASRRRHLSEIMQGAGTPNVRRGQAAQADAATKLHTAQVCLRCGAIDEAGKAAREALMLRGDLPDAIVVLVTTLFAKDPHGPCIEALGWVNRGLKLAPDSDQMHVLAGRAHARRGDSARALEHFYRAYKINSTNMDAVRELRVAAARHRSGAGAGAGAGATETSTGGKLLAKIFGR